MDGEGILECRECRQLLFSFWPAAINNGFSFACQSLLQKLVLPYLFTLFPSHISSIINWCYFTYLPYFHSVLPPYPPLPRLSNYCDSPR
jgi:hypothetical protein